MHHPEGADEVLLDRVEISMRRESPRRWSSTTISASTRDRKPCRDARALARAPGEANLPSTKRRLPFEALGAAARAGGTAGRSRSLHVLSGRTPPVASPAARGFPASVGGIQERRTDHRSPRARERHSARTRRRDPRGTERQVAMASPPPKSGATEQKPRSGLLSLFSVRSAAPLAHRLTRPARDARCVKLHCCMHRALSLGAFGD